MKPLRGQLIQVSTLKDIHSESRDGAGIIRLSFDYGTNTDLAFIEVNEKIDAAMNFLPKETERPKVIRASATDIPVFYLNLTLKNDTAGYGTGEAFLDLFIPFYAGIHVRVCTQTGIFYLFLSIFRSDFHK